MASCFICKIWQLYTKTKLRKFFTYLTVGILLTFMI